MSTECLGESFLVKVKGEKLGVFFTLAGTELVLLDSEKCALA